MYRHALLALLSVGGCKPDGAASSSPPAPASSAQLALKQIITDVEDIEEPPAGTVYLPPSEADFAAIHPVFDPALGTVCAIRIEVAPRANYNRTRVDVVYARDGRLSARVDEFYSRDGNKRARREPSTYSWENGRLVATPFSTQSYDANGLLVEQSWGPGTARTLAWKVTPISSYAPLTLPSYVDELAQLPLQLPYTGTVTVTTKGSKTEIARFNYNAHGELVLPDQRRDPGGKIVRDRSSTWRWRDNAVVGQDLDADAYEYTYDDQRRLVRQRLVRRGAFEEELRWEYRCPGPWIDDPIWPR